MLYKIYNCNTVILNRIKYVLIVKIKLLNDKRCACNKKKTTNKQINVKNTDDGISYRFDSKKKDIS